MSRIEAWGEEYDQPPASGYTEGDPGRTRKVSKVKKVLIFMKDFQ